MVGGDEFLKCKVKIGKADIDMNTDQISGLPSKKINM